MVFKIGNKIYDTSKAKHIAGPSVTGEHLYRRYRGEYFLTKWVKDDTPDGHEVVVPVTYVEAKAWCHDNMPTEYESEFGVVPEDTDSGFACACVSVRKDILERAKRMARANNMNLSEYLFRDIPEKGW